MEKKLKKVFYNILLFFVFLCGFLVINVNAETITNYDTSMPMFKIAKFNKDTNDFLKDAWLTVNQYGKTVASFSSLNDFYELPLGNGTYQLAEKIAPTGYKLASPVTFTIDNNRIVSGGKDVTIISYINNLTGQSISEDEYNALSDTLKANYTLQTNSLTVIAIEGTVAKGSLTITKKDKDDSSKTLANAKYRLWGTTLDGKPIDMQFTTDENGKHTIEGLPLGNYNYQEIEAPKGYEKDEEVHTLFFGAQASVLQDGPSTVTSKDTCETYTSNSNYEYYDYDNGAYSSDKSYYEKKFDGSLYIGGNAKSSIQENAEPHTDLDDDVNDFTKILPYGTVFINTNKLNFKNATITFPEQSPFHYIKQGDFEVGVDGTQLSNDTYAGGIDANGSIVYLGSLKSYIKGVGAPGAYGTPTFGQLTEEGYSALINNGDTETSEVEHNDDTTVEYGNTKISYYKTGEYAGQNVITNTVDGYLYQVKFYDAAILSDGSVGDLIISFDKMIMEASTDKLENVPYVIHSKANEICSRINVQFNNGGNKILKWPNYLYSPSSNNKDATSLNGTYKIANAIGVSNEFSIKVVNKNGQAVNGAISYSLRDIDLATAENIWGRKTGSTEYSEGMEIVSGSKSFAVMPKYDHVSYTGTIQDGYVFGNDMAINVEKVLPGNNADGLRFNSFTYTNIRDDAGKKIGGSTNNTNTVAYIKNETAYNTRNGKRYALQRADNTTFDSGFAVLLDPSSTKLRWTGSSTVLGLSSVNTQIFDTTAFVILQQSHGTGGDLFVEAYDYTDDCKMNPIRRDVSMGVGESSTVAIVPDNDWEIEKITIDGTTVDFNTLTFNDEGKATYNFNGTTYTLVKDSANPKKVRVSFDDVRENHSISAEYKPAKKLDVTNKKAYGTLTINKKDAGTGVVMTDVEFTLSGVSDLNENINITKKTDDNGQIKIENIPAGEYNLHETTPKYYKDNNDVTVVIARSKETKEVTLNITNEQIKHDLIINKTVSGTDKDETKEFDLNIKLFDRDSNPVSGEFVMIKNDEEQRITIDSNGYDVKIKHNDTIVIKNIITNYTFKITEKDTDYNEYYSIKTTSKTILDTTKGLTASGVLDEETTISFINSKDKIIVPAIIIPETSDNIINCFRIWGASIIGLCYSIKHIRDYKLKQNNN